MTTTHYQTGLKTQKRVVLERGVKQLGLSCSDEQIHQLLIYLEMLDRWNQAYNLTAIKDPLEMIGLHLLDSLAVSPMLNGESCIDVGTGAGLPGVPLAIMNPNKKFTLLDSNGKKTRFLFQTKIELKLSNIQEVNTRVEKYLPEHGYDHVLS
ncbi:MAG: 16S rRNA (guanine(527)-N(7))-methyltransferase RsmG, partial [Porticoccaceae bacterium]|nr:16S rRNA (guanine(527)-N(7))-methyltransferase RsmG [Porticoccaceae bacterium]